MRIFVAPPSSVRKVAPRSVNLDENEPEIRNIRPKRECNPACLKRMAHVPDRCEPPRFKVGEELHHIANLK